MYSSTGHNLQFEAPCIEVTEAVCAIICAVRVIERHNQERQVNKGGILFKWLGRPLCASS